MEMHASGSFEVQMEAKTTRDDGDGIVIGEWSLEKTFSGDMVGTSKGTMLTAMTDVPGSAGYVAIERFRGTLSGRSGTFVLQHSGTTAKGDEGLSVTVVPDSATGELKGLSGRMTIEQVDGRHRYSLEYDLEQPPSA